MKQWLREFIIKRPVGFLIIIVLGCFIVPFFLINIIKWLDMFIDPNGICGTRLPDGINVWFSFWGSYLGGLATIILGVITIYLTLKISEINCEQNQSQMASAFHKLIINQCQLFDIYREFPVEIMERFTNKKRYILKIESEEPFSPYFEIKLSNLGWGKPDSNENFMIKDFDYCIENNETLIFYITFNLEEFKKNGQIHTDYADIKYFYHINLFEPKGMPPHEKVREISIKLDCKNNLSDGKKAGSLTMNLDLQVVNLGFDSKSKGVNLKVCKRELYILSEEKVKNKGK